MALLASYTCPVLGEQERFKQQPRISGNIIYTALYILDCMPISLDEFNQGEARDPLNERIMRFLAKNTSEAFNVVKFLEGWILEKCHCQPI
jgi:hypothetical protein